MLNTWRGIVRDLSGRKGAVVKGRRGIVAEAADGELVAEVGKEKEKGMREVGGMVREK